MCNMQCNAKNTVLLLFVLIFAVNNTECSIYNMETAGFCINVYVLVTLTILMIL